MRILAGFLLAAPIAGGLIGCSPGIPGEPLEFSVDLRRAVEGAIDVRLRLPAPAGRTLTLSSLVQPEALRLEGLRVSQSGMPLPVERALEGGFERWRIAPPRTDDPVLVQYTVLPGAEEKAKMAGPTGYRFGHLDARFGLLAGRQLFILPVEPSAPAAFRVIFTLPPGWEIVAPWPREGAGGAVGTTGVAAFRVDGAAAPARLLRAVLGAGVFETRAARGPEGSVVAGTEPPGFRIHASSSLPAEVRARSIERALVLEEFLASRLGQPRRSYDLFLLPRAPTGSYISVTPAPEGFGLSLDAGLATRWLSIGRALGRAYLEDRIAALAEDDPTRWILEALPTYLSVRFSEREGWRTSQVWFEQFYYHSAGLDLTDRSHEDQRIAREWRAALVLHHLSQARNRARLESIEDALLYPSSREEVLAWSPLLRRMPGQARQDFEAWLSPAPYPFPFPGEDRGGPPRMMAPPPPIEAGRKGRRIDLYLGGRNLGLLEQCGCRSQQTGGMARRAALLRPRLAGPPMAIAVEIGDAVPFDQKSPALDRQKVAEADLALSLLAEAGTAGLSVSHAELAYGPGFLRDRAARLPANFHLFSANVEIPGLTLRPDLWVAPEPGRSGRRPLRIIGLLDPSNYHLGRALEYEDATAGIRIVDPVEALRRTTDGPRSRETLAVVGYISPTTVLRLVREFPGLPLVITHDYFRFNEDRRLRFERAVEGLSTFGLLDGTLVVQLQSDAYGLVRLGLLLRDDGSIAGAEIEDLVLDESVPDDPGVRARLDAHYARLARESGLADHPPVGDLLVTRLQARFVGVGACAACHDSETEQWRTTGHAAAFASLLARNRQGVPGCFACHVTGYRQEGGYRTVADAPMRHVQCEACHGPGRSHVAEPRRDNIVRTPPAVVCRECHNEKHSDMTDANYEDYRRRVLHAPPEG